MIEEHVKFVNGRYVVHKEYKWASRIFKKTVICEYDFESDGATYAPDIDSYYWLVHDKLKKTRKWYDGKHCPNWKASVCAAEILYNEKRHLWVAPVFLGTLVYGYIKQLLKGLRG